MRLRCRELSLSCRQTRAPGCGQRVDPAADLLALELGRAVLIEQAGGVRLAGAVNLSDERLARQGRKSDGAVRRAGRGGEREDRSLGDGRRREVGPDLLGPGVHAPRHVSHHSVALNRTAVGLGELLGGVGESGQRGGVGGVQPADRQPGPRRVGGCSHKSDEQGQGQQTHDRSQDEAPVAAHRRAQRRLRAAGGRSLSGPRPSGDGGRSNNLSSFRSLASMLMVASPRLRTGAN